MWVANTNDGTISRIDERSGDVTATFAAGGSVASLAFGFGSRWAAHPTLGQLVRIDARTRQLLQPINVGNGPTSVAVGAGAVWVANGADGTISRVDPETNSVTSTVPIGTGGENDVVASDEAVWVSDETAGAIANLDPANGEVLELVEVGNRPQGVGLAGGAVYVAVRASTAAHRGGTLRVLAEFIDSVDPALAYSPAGWATLIMTNDGLMTFRRVGGSRGIELVPALARALPTPTNGGRTYTFRLRNGIRYSTGTQLRAGDFRFALERAFRTPNSPIGGFLSKVVGAARCGPKACDLSRGVVGDERAGTVTFHLAGPDPELPYKLALPFTFPVPRGTPPARAGRPVPATGPYTVTRANAEQVRLVRNPTFREWSAAAQPDGIPDEIVLRVVPDADRRVNAVLSGEADLFWGHDSPTPDRLQDLRTRFASRLHSAPYNGTFFFALDNRRGPFSKPNVRRALNYAIDREEIVRLFGGPESVRATCQVLPPGLPGYVPYCPYTSSQRSDGAWSAPDLAAAKGLVDRSGTRGALVTVVYSPSLPGPGVAPYVASVLRRLGYRVRLRAIEGFSEYFDTIDDPRRMGDAAISGWVADYAAPYGFVNRQFSCDVRRAPNYAGFCDPRVDRKTQRALELQATDPHAANRLWAEVDRDLVNQAPWLFLVNPRVADLVSERVGNYQYNPQWGVLIDQLWVR